MWSGGYTTPITDSAGATAAREEQNKLSSDLLEQETATRNARNELEDTNHNASMAQEKRQEVYGDERYWLGEARQRNDARYQAEQSDGQNRHELGVQQDQLGSDWRQWWGSKGVADNLQSIYNSQLFGDGIHSGYIGREIAAFFDEWRQKQGEIALIMNKARRKMQEAGQWNITKSQLTLEPQFKEYTNFRDIPQNQAIHQYAQVRGEYDKLIERGRLLQDRIGDPFVRQKLQEAVNRLSQSRDSLQREEEGLHAARSAEEAARSNMLSARDVYGTRESDVGKTRNDSANVQKDISNYIDKTNDDDRKLRQEALDRQRQHA